MFLELQLLLIDQKIKLILNQISHVFPVGKIYKKDYLKLRFNLS